MTYRTRPDKGWAWFVLIGSFGAHMIHGFFGYAIGILNFAFLERFNGDVEKTAWACGLFLGLFSLSGPLTGMIVNKWSCRVSMMTGSILMTVGLVVTAFVNELDYVIVSYGIISGFTVLIGGLFGWSVACFDRGKASRQDGNLQDVILLVEEHGHNNGMNKRSSKEMEEFIEYPIDC